MEARLALAMLAIGFTVVTGTGEREMRQEENTRIMELPRPALRGDASLEEALRARRSVRSFSRESVSLTDVSQLLWAAQGTTSPDGGRTAPSAGALYPLELLLVAGAVEDLPPGVYRYSPQRHDLTLLRSNDVRAELAAAAVGQEWIGEAAAALVLAAVYERTTSKYGRRGERYVHMEVGHAAQNVCLQAVACGLGTTVVGAFDDAEVGRLLGLAARERAQVLLPVGRPR